MRGLWASVLLVQWNEAFSITEKRTTMLAMSSHSLQRSLQAKRHDAQRWFGGRDFRKVCELAGIEPEFIMRKFYEMMVRNRELATRPIAGIL